jgi:hypothetical protein
METKDLTISRENIGLKFRCTNLTDLRDESIYGRIKMDTQREYLLIVFLYNIINLYLEYYHRKYACDVKYGWKKIYDDPTFISSFGITKDKEIYFIREMEEFKIFYESNRDRFPELEFDLDIICKYGFHTSETFIKIFNLYDDHFNSRIILQNLCGIELNPDQFYSIILYFSNKTKYLEHILEPSHNTRSLIIKNFYPSKYPNDSGIHLSLKNSRGVDYVLDNVDRQFSYNFDEKFKQDILHNNYNDGYDFYWKPSERDEFEERKDRSRCLKFLVEILNPHDEQIISMIIIKSPTIQNKQIHFYIKKNLVTQIKSFITRRNPYKNVSLIIHSFASWLFTANMIYSNLMPSMNTIFKNNGINVNYIDYDEDDEIIKLGSFCIRGIVHKINIDEAFRNLWIGSNKIKEIDGTIKTYQLLSSDDSKNKYLKYKMKYIQLKKNYASQYTSQYPNS